MHLLFHFINISLSYFSLVILKGPSSAHLLRGLRYCQEAFSGSARLAQGGQGSSRRRSGPGHALFGRTHLASHQARARPCRHPHGPSGRWRARDPPTWCSRSRRLAYGRNHGAAEQVGNGLDSRMRIEYILL